MVDKILKWAMYLGLFLMPFIPLFVSSSLFFPYISGKNFAFRIIIEIVLALWLILLSRKAIEGPKSSWVLIAVSVFIGAITLSTIFGENPYRSFWSNFERMDGLINLLHLFAYFFVMISVLTKEKIWHWYLHATLGSAMITSIIGVLQFFGKAAISQSNTRIDGTFGNATYFAVYMLFHIFIAIFFLVKKETQIWFRVGYGALTILFGFVIYHTATRGAILGLLGGLLLAFVLSTFSTTGKSRKWAVGAVVVFLAFGATFYLARNSKFIRESPTLGRFSNISLKDSTTRTRFIVWGMALRGVMEHPLLGWGPENFNILFNKYYDPHLHSQETWFDRAHNVFFDWLTMGGILGLLSYLSIFLAVVWTLWKKVSSISPLQRSILVGLFAGYFFQNLFVFDNLTSYLLFFSMIAYVHFLNEKETEFAPVKKLQELGGSFKNLLASFQPIVVVLVPIVFVFVIYFANVKPILANNTMLKSVYPRSISAEKLVTLKHVFDLNTFGSMEAREQLIFMLTELRGAKDLDETLLVQYLELGLSQMQEQLGRTGNDARHQLFMGSFLHTYGKVNEALVYYENALKLSPKKQLVLTSISRAYLDKGDFSEALRYAKDVHELDKSYSRGLIEYITMAILTKNFSLADSLINDNYRTDIVTDPRVVQALVVSNKIDRVVAIWEKEVATNPNRPQNYFSLAASYYLAGRDKDAIATLRKLIVLDQTTKDQAEYYIKGITEGTLPRQ